MPELPEVETIVRGLALCIVGRTIERVGIHLARVLQPHADVFTAGAVGRTIVACSRRAKYIVLVLDDDSRIVVHLRMTGRLIFEADPTIEREKYTNVELDFVDGTRLFFADARTFGRMRLVAPDEDWQESLGVEPLSPDFTVEVLRAIFARRTTPVKTFLLDQRHIAGIGNIYACEALWQARISPATPAGSLSIKAVARLHAALVDVLLRAVDMRGTSARDYVDAEGLKGGFQNVLEVYGRHGEPCRRCARPLVRTVLSQRGTWWCRSCQKAKL